MSYSLIDTQLALLWNSETSIHTSQKTCCFSITKEGSYWYLWKKYPVIVAFVVQM